MMKGSTPDTESRGTPNNISFQELNDLSIFALCFQ